MSPHRLTAHARRSLTIFAAVSVALVGLYGITSRKPQSVARMSFPPASGRTLTGTSACVIPEGTRSTGTCVITISPPAPAGSSVTFNLTPQTTGTPTTAFSPLDALGRVAGGTGHDITLLGTGGSSNSVLVPIPAGATSVAFPITATDDEFPEYDETIVATITAPVGVTIDGSAAAATITIVDNDRTGVFPAANYGAVPGDGISDSAAIQAAVAAANASGRGIVSLPAGQLELTPAANGPIRPGPGTAVYGAGDRATLLRRAANQCGNSLPVTPRCSTRDIVIDQWDAAGDSPWTVLSNFIIDGNNANQCDAINPTLTYDCHYDFRLEHAHLIYLSGHLNAGTARAYNTGRLRVVTQHLTTRSSVADGISLNVNVEHRNWDTRGEGNFRGHLVATGGNTTAQWWNFTTTHGGDTGLPENTGIDVEVDAYGRHPTKSYTVDINVDIRNATIDADLDVSTLLPSDSWISGCFYPTGNTSCGTGSSITVDNVQMSPSGPNYYRSAGGVFLGTMRSQDTVTVSNSLLRVGGHNVNNENMVWLNQGTINVIDSRVIIGEYPFPGHNASYAQPSLRIASNGQTFSGGTANFIRTTFEADTGANAPASKCAAERMHPTLPTVNWSSVTLIGTGWCGSGGGFTGGAVNTGGTVTTLPPTTSLPGATTTTTTTLPPTTTTLLPGATTLDDATAAFVFSPIASTPTTTTSPATTTTTTPPPTQVQIESCTLGASVVTNAFGPTGQSGSAVFGDNSVGAGTTASCPITAPAAGTYNLTLRYNNSGAYQRPVTVNGSALSPPTGPSFADTTNTWSTLTLSVTLVSGANTIVIDTSYQWFDWIEIAATGAATTTTSATTTTIAPSETTGWVAYAPPVYDPDDYLFTNHATKYTGATATITFTGNAAILYGATGPKFGKATITIDGGPATTVDLYDPVGARQVPIWTAPAGLSAATHTIVFTAAGTKNTSSTDYYVVLDKLVYTAVAVATTTTTTSTTTPATTTTTTTTIGVTTTTRPCVGCTLQRVRTLVWSDEFSTLDLTTAVHTGKWRPNDYWQNIARGYLEFGGLNWNANPNETAVTVPNPFSIRNGALRITATRIPPGANAAIAASMAAQSDSRTPPTGPNGWTSGYLVADPAHRTFTYGYFEWRARFQAKAGMFPALWLYSSDGGVAKNEIDVLEVFGYATGKPWSTTVHVKNAAGVDLLPELNVANTNTDTTAWHTYAVDWQPGWIRFYRDGQLIATTPPGWVNPMNTPMQPRINLAVDPFWAAPTEKTNGSTPPFWMEVDYLRVWNKR